jgi:hypothetical protein
VSTSRFALAALCALVATLLPGVVEGSAQPTAGRADGRLNLQLPGLQAAADISTEQLRSFKAHGYDWITYRFRTEVAPSTSISLRRKPPGSAQASGASPAARRRSSPTVSLSAGRP